MVDREAILKEIEELTTRPSVDPEDDFTIAQLCKKFGVSEAGIRYRMNQLVRAGKYSTELKFDPEKKRVVRVWWKLFT